MILKNVHDILNKIGCLGISLQKKGRKTAGFMLKIYRFILGWDLLWVALSELFVEI